MANLFPAMTFGLIQDILLILISGLACLYCIALNRRVKGLSNMKTGLGASIVSLTDAIRQTQAAAQDTEATTLEAIHKLQSLMDEAESTISKLEARKIDLDRLESSTLKATQRLRTQTEYTIQTLATLESKTHDLENKTSDLDRNVDKAAKLADLQQKLAQRIKTELPTTIAEVDTVTSRLQKAMDEIKTQKTLRGHPVPTQAQVPEAVAAHKPAPIKLAKPTSFTELLQIALGAKILNTETETEPKAPSVTLFKPTQPRKPRDIVQIGNLEPAQAQRVAS